MVDDLSSSDTVAKPKLQDPPQCILDLTEVKQLQWQGTHLSTIIAKCTSHSHHNETPYYLDDNGIVYRKVRDGSNIFHNIMVPQKLQPYILYECHNALGHNGTTRLYTFIKRFYYWKKLYQDCSKYVRSCAECQQVTSKEPQYVNLHLPILQFPMAFISMDLLGPHSKTESGSQYVLTVICMLTNYIFMTLIKTKTTKDVINAYLKHVYAVFSSSKYILSDRVEHFATNQMSKDLAWCTPPLIPQQETQ